MDSIDYSLYVGSLLDAEEVLTLIRRDIDLVIDARLCFSGPPNIQPIPEKVFKMADLLKTLASTDAKVLLHCVWGVDRTPFIAMAYYARRYGVSYATAYDLVKGLHPNTVIHLDWVYLLINAVGNSSA